VKYKKGSDLMKALKNKSLLADLSLLLVAIIWGGGFIAVKDSVNLVPPFYQMTIRFFLSTLIMAIIFNKSLRKATKADFKMGTIIGIFLFLGFALQTVGIVYTTASKSAFLTATYVVIVPFLNWAIFKLKLDKFSVIGAILCLIGISFLTLQGGLNLNGGDILTILGSIGFAGQIITIGLYTKKTDPIILTIIQFGVAAILSFIMAIFFEPVPQFETKLILPIAYMVIFSTTLCFIIQNVAQKYTTSTHAAIILSLECLFGSLFSVLIFGDKFTFFMIVGCIFIFIAIITTETKLSFIFKNANSENLLADKELEVASGENIE
jgi:drug/metabolite transporter (DMT)-like permease